MSPRDPRDTDPSIEFHEIERTEPDLDPVETVQIKPEEAARARADAAYELSFREMSRQVDMTAGPLTPAERVRLGLDLARRGLVEGRAEMERLDYKRELVRAGLVDGENGLRVLATQAMAARRPRMRAPFEESGPRRRHVDSQRSIVITSPVDEVTHKSLVRMALVPPPRAARTEEPEPVAAPSLFERLRDFFVYRSPPKRMGRVAPSDPARLEMIEE